jgi:hypothetical protein
MTIEQELQRRQVFEIYPGDRVYLTHLHYPVQLLKNSLKRKKEAKIVNDHNNADIVILDELFLQETIAAKLMHDPRSVQAFEDRTQMTPSKKRLKETVAYILSREDTRYILLKDVYPMFLKTVEEKDLPVLKEAFDKSNKIGAMTLAGYDPYSVLECASVLKTMRVNLSSQDVYKINKLYSATRSGINFRKSIFSGDISVMAKEILDFKHPHIKNSFNKISAHFTFKDEKIIKKEISDIDYHHNLAQQLWKGYLKEAIAH